MDNQHRKISGYGELTQEEIDMINDVKMRVLEVVAIASKVYMSIPPSSKSSAGSRARWAKMAMDSLETGSMQLVKAISNP